MLQYKNKKFDVLTKSFLATNQKDENFEELWKRELDYLSGCRTFKDISDTNILDPIIKLDFLNDLKAYYMSVVDSRGEDFIMSDIYPTLEIYPTLIANINMHALFPISPTRLLILNNLLFKDEFKSEDLSKSMRSISRIKGDIIKPPKNKYNIPGVLLPDDEFRYKVNKIYSDDVEYINALILNEAKVGLIFKNKEKIISSIKSFNKRNDTKQKFYNLEKSLDINE